jgi:hypothetical protein
MGDSCARPGVSCLPMCELVSKATAAAIDPITSLTLVLAALTALLTVMAIIIGIAAVFGYFGIRDSVKDMAQKRVDQAVTEALNKYPDSAVMFKVLDRLSKQADFWDQARNQAVTAPEPKSVENSSKPDITGDEESVLPVESMGRQVTPIEPYPGEEPEDASSSGKNPE